MVINGEKIVSGSEVIGLVYCALELGSSHLANQTTFRLPLAVFSISRLCNKSLGCAQPRINNKRIP